MHIKRLIILILFFILWACCTYLARRGSLERDGQLQVMNAQSIMAKTSFTNMLYFQLLSGQKKLFIESSQAEIIGDDRFEFHPFTGHSFDQKHGEKIIHFKSQDGHFIKSQGLLTVEKNARIEHPEYQLVGEKLTYWQNQQKIQGEGQINFQSKDAKTQDRLNLSGQEFVFLIEKGELELKGDVKGQILRPRVYEGKVDVMAEKLNYYKSLSQIDLFKNVQLKRNNYLISAENGQLFMENYNKRLKYYVFYDDVRFTEKFKDSTGEEILRKAYGERLEGFMQTGRILLTGSPRVEQGTDILKGYQISFKESEELVEVDDSQYIFKWKR